MNEGMDGCEPWIPIESDSDSEVRCCMSISPYVSK